MFKKKEKTEKAPKNKKVRTMKVGTHKKSVLLLWAVLLACLLYTYSYFTVNAIVGELDFPSSEIFYFQQQQFTFPVDTSMNVEIVGNKKDVYKRQVM